MLCRLVYQYTYIRISCTSYACELYSFVACVFF